MNPLLKEFGYKEKDINLKFIAHNLSNIYRYNGRTRYPVAQHSVYVARILIAKNRHPVECLDGLHHDDDEAFTGDIVSMVKRRFKGLRALGNAFRELIYFKLDIQSTNYSQANIHLIDMVIRKHEIHDLIKKKKSFYLMPLKGMPKRIKPWSSKKAAREYLKLHKFLTKKLKHED